MQHGLKIHPEYFKAISLGLKKVEIRFNDRNFQERDVLILKEYCPEKKQYTGHIITRKIDYIIKDVPGLQPNFVILQIINLI